MRILLASDIVLDPRFGAARVHLGLAEQFRAMGHEVTLLTRSEVVPRTPRTRLAPFVSRRFSRRALPRLAALAHDFDVIDAFEGIVPYPKQRIGFDGLLVARVTALSSIFNPFFEEARRRWPVRGREKGHPVVDAMRSARTRFDRSQYESSWREADLLMVANHEELEHLSRIGLGAKVRVMPHGLPPDRRRALGAYAADSALRHARREVSFIGYWSGRKGAFDWGEIIRLVRARVPDARFVFAGTWESQEVVLGDLGLSRCDWVRVYPAPDPDELPGLVGPATVGGFPSYLENFGIAVVEHLAAGQPVVAYDVAGPRDTLQPVAPDWLVPPGDVAAFADRLVRFLRLPLSEYAALSSRALEFAPRFGWERVASDMATLYETGLAELTSRRSAERRTA